MTIQENKAIKEEMLLRPIEAGDLNVLREMMNDPGIEYSVTGWSLPISTVAQQKWFEEVLPKERSTVRMMIELNGKETIGCVYLHDIDPVNKTGEIGIKILRKFQGKNYPYRALVLFRDHCFNKLGIYCIYGKCLVSNVATQRLLRILGTRSEGRQRSAIFKDGKRHDLLHFSLTAEDFRRMT